MRMFLVAATLTLSGAMAAGQGEAQAVTAVIAKAELFPTEGIRMEISPASPLKPEESKQLFAVAKMSPESFPYYAAIAVAPDENFQKSEATTALGNFHSAKAAEAAALAGCNAKRKGGRTCAIAATVRPKDWTDRPLQLSKEATAAMGKDYGRRGPRALAISSGSGAWGMGKGNRAPDAALAGCAAKGASDCTIVVQD